MRARLKTATSIAVVCVTLMNEHSANADAIRLSTGEILNVQILEATDATIRFRHAVLGEVTVPRDTVEVLPAATEAVIEAKPAVAAEPTSTATAAAPAEAPVEPAEPSPWKFKLTFAGSGATGNSENLGVVAKFDAVRETEKSKLAFDSGFFHSESDGVTSENKFTAGLRHDWLNPDSKWFYFAQTRYDFDDFQSWDHRVSGHVGVGYKLIEPPKWRLNLLAGIGAIREWGSENDDVRPEALLGVEGEWQIADKHSLKFDSTIFPDLKETGEFRLVNNVGYSVILDEKTNLSLTAGLAHEYQSDVSPDRKHNDLRVFAGIALEF